jgi:aminoglycoside 2'-N-acetyltransferase I
VDRPEGTRMVTLTLTHTADADAADLAAAEDLLAAAFSHLPPDEAFGPDDWEHALGGMHALLHGDGVMVAHASLVMRRMVHGGRALRCGYVEAVAVAPDRQRQGLGGRVMAAVESLAPAYDLLALGATDEGMGLYLSHGWLPWRGRLSALTPDGVVPTRDEEGYVLVLPGTAQLDIQGELTCDWRDGDVW